MPPPVEPTSRLALDAAVAELKARRSAWVAIAPSARIRLLDELVRDVAAVADRWVASCVEAKDLDPAEPSSAEEAIVGPYLVLRYLRFLRTSLRGIERAGAPRIPGPVTTRPDGRVVARVFPADRFDRLMYLGVSGDVWMAPGVSAAELPATQAVAYRRPDAGAVCLVLGAGNVSSIGPLDALGKLFVENRVVILKTHPVNAYLGPLLEAGLAALIREGFLRIVHGGAVEGGYLCHHPDVEELHITGSDRTYEAIVYGAGPEGRERKLRDEPLLHKPFSAELGNITPVIVVPGPWSAADVAYQADNVATMLTNNAGFNCTTSRVIVTHAGWSGRERFLDAVGARLAATPTRHPYYPGAFARHEAFTAAHPEARLFGSSVGDRLPWALIGGLDPAAGDEICYTTEAFCGISGETTIEANSVAEYLDRAVEFTNERLWGTLNATLIVHPASLRDADTAAAIERAIANLRYGTVALNHWSALGFGLGVTPWGAFPGHARHDIESGTGFVHDALMFSRAEKTVLRAPFRAWPKPVWFGSHGTAHRLAARLVRFEADPGLRHLRGIFALALRG
jgi:hypothetical protein